MRLRLDDSPRNRLVCVHSAGCRSNLCAAAMRRLLSILAIASSTAFGASCAAPQPTSSQAAVDSGDAIPNVSRALATPGADLCIPIQRLGASDPTGRLVDVRLDGQLLQGRVQRFHVRPAPHHSWIASAAAWSIGDNVEPNGQGDFITIDWLFVPLPENAAGDLQIGSHEIEIDWRDDVPADFPDIPLDAGVPVELNGALGQSQLFQSVAPLTADPTKRWRLILLAGRLDAGGYTVLANRIRAALEHDGAIATLSAQRERQWRLGLDRLASADPARAARVILTLTRVASMRGVVQPAWTPSIVSGPAGNDAQLLDDLLNMDLSVATMLARIDAWLDAQPGTVAWIVDDAGAANPGAGFALVRAHVVDLAGEGGIASASLTPDRPGPRASVPPFGSANVVASASLPVESTTLDIRLGSWFRQFPVVAGAIPARPPGVRMAPLLRPWSLETWLTDHHAPATNELESAALLTRRTNGAWELRIECRTAASTTGRGDVIRIFLGSTQQPRAVLQVDSRGFMFDELERTEDEPPPQRPIAVRQHAGGWAFTLEIADEWIEPGDHLRIGLERRTPDGERATWPRPIMPFDDAPGRALIQLDDWFGLGQTGLRAR